MEIIEKQAQQAEEMAVEAGMTKEEFMEKALQEQEAKKARKPKKQPAKPKKQPEKPAKQPAKGKGQATIIGVKDLEKEFKIPGKTIRRHLRKMEENKKPRGPEPYEWKASDPNLKKIKAKLKAIADRKS
jgi:hypothetical protein